MVSRNLIKEIEGLPIKISDSEIQMERVETWLANKVDLLAQKQLVEQHIAEYQKQLAEIDALLLLFEATI